MSDKELWELISIICEGQDSEQRRKVEQYITNLQKENERLVNELNNCMIERNQFLSRNEEAIKYVNNQDYEIGYECLLNKDYLLDILQGEDKDVKNN